MIPKTILIIPARDEAATLPGVLRNIPDGVDRVVVVDNGSVDNTARIATTHGATVVVEPRHGYGRACLAGITHIKNTPPDIVAFADADGSDELDTLVHMIREMAEGKIDFALAARKYPEPGAMSIPQEYGNKLAVWLIHLFWKHRYTDLGPMRAITWTALEQLDMVDPNYGWTVEMQIKALLHGLRIKEFFSGYKKRAAGRSKVSRSLGGTLRAGVKIIGIILWFGFKKRF